MKLLVADQLSSDVVNSLADGGCDVRFEPDLTSEQLATEVGETNVLVVRSTKVPSDVIDNARHLSLIVRAGAGVNNIDVEAASARGIYVSNCPGRNSDAVAELAMGMIIACDRRIVDASAALRSGHWRKKEFGKAAGLRGRTLGVLGLGMIGRAVARLGVAFGMDVVGWSRSLTPASASELGIGLVGSPIEIASVSDAVTLHLALKPETRGLVDSQFLDRMKPGAILVNTARGELVDYDALQTVIREKELRVGLDVFDNEPAGGTNDFQDLELASGVTCTPHIGASTAQASQAIADEVVRIVRSFRETGRPINAVNLCERSPATHSLAVRHFNRIGVIAGVLDSLRAEGINVEEMDNTIFEGATAACCTLRLDQRPSESFLSGIEANQNILQVTLERVESDAPT